MQGDDRFDVTLGMTTEEKADYAHAQVRRAALDVDRPEGDDANMAAFRMNEDSSVAGTVAGDRSVAAYSLGAKSLFSFGPGDLESLDDEMDGAAHRMPDEDGGEVEFVFEMPRGGLGAKAGSDDGMMDTGSKEGNQDEVSDRSRGAPASQDREMDQGETPEQEDSLSLPHIGDVGAIPDSLARLHLFVAGQFPRYAGKSSMDIMKGWGDVAIMLEEFGAEIDEEIDESTDLVVQGDNADDKVTSEAAKWNVPIVGVKEIKRVIRGLLKVRLILTCSTMSCQEEEEALKHVGEVTAGENTITPIITSKKTPEEGVNQTARGEENSPDGSKEEDQHSTSVLEDAGSTGWAYEANEEVIDDGRDNMQTSTPTGRSQGDRTTEPPQETQGEDSLPSPMAQEAGKMGCDSSRPG
jgi:hypothetical protein